MPATSSKYHRPSYLRSLELYEALKKTYDYGRGFVVVRSVAPMAERLVEGALARTPFIKSLKEPPKGEEAEQQQQHAPAAGYPTLHGIDMRLAAMLAHLDDYVDSNLGNPKTLQGRALRVATHTIHAIAGYTPVVGMRIKQLMVEIDPEHMAPRLLGRPAGLDVNGENGEDPDLRASFDKDLDDVSVVTDASEEVAAAQAKGGKGKKKDKRKDKRFLQNMGKGIKKVMNYPRTPVHDIVPPGTNGSGAGESRADAPSIGGEEEASLASGTTPVQPASSTASIASTDAVASTGGSSSTASTPLRAATAKFFGSGGKKGKAAAAAASTSEPSSA